MKKSRVTFNRDHKFDLQLSAAREREKVLGEIFTNARLARVELKSESYQWEQTGNICVEYRCDGRPSGISTTEADIWVHELRREDQTLMWMMFPIERIKDVTRQAIQQGRVRKRAGDGGRFTVAIVPLRHLLR
jgi:hypothetical protein